MSTDENKKVTFDNVAGLREEKEELEEIVDFLQMCIRDSTMERDS